MSAPQTNIEKQKKRHWAPLIGMALAALFGVLLILYWIGEEVAGSDPERPAEGTTSQPTAAPNEVIPPDAQQGRPAPSPSGG